MKPKILNTTLMDTVKDWSVNAGVVSDTTSKAKVKTAWTMAHWFIFNCIPIEILLTDDYFFGWRGNELFDVHKTDILELFHRKTPRNTIFPNCTRDDFAFQEAGLSIPSHVLDIYQEFFETEGNVVDVKSGDRVGVRVNWGGEGEDIRVFVDEEATRSGKTWKGGLIQGLLMFKNAIIPNYRMFYPRIADAGGKVGFLAMSRNVKLSQDRLFQDVMLPILHNEFFLDYFPPQVTVDQINEFKRNPGALKFPPPADIAMEAASGTKNELEGLGYTVISALMDEANFYEFIERSTRRQAAVHGGVFDAARLSYDDLYIRIDNQFAHQGRWPAWALLQPFSSAGYKGDLTSTLIRQAKDGDHTIFYRERTSWDANPDSYTGEFFDFDISELRPVDEEGAIQRYEKKFGKGFYARKLSAKAEDLD